jgi:hypothetical protein
VGAAACLDSLCTTPLNLVFVEHALCFAGERHMCDASGWASPSPCPQGQACVGDGQCDPGPEPCEAQDERCNLLDDDCDGIVDEALTVILGSPCQTNLVNCDALGVWSCSQGEVPVCVTDPTLCPPHMSGGIFSTPETPVEPPAPVTTTCASGPTPEVPMVLLVLWLMARVRRHVRSGA